MTTVIQIFERKEKIPIPFITELIRRLKGEVLLQTIPPEKPQILTPSPEGGTTCSLIVVYTTSLNPPERLEDIFSDLRTLFPDFPVRTKFVK